VFTAFIDACDPINTTGMSHLKGMGYGIPHSYIHCIPLNASLHLTPILLQLWYTVLHGLVFQTGQKIRCVSPN